MKFTDRVVAVATAFEDHLVKPIVKTVEGVLERNSAEVSALEGEAKTVAQETGMAVLTAAAPILEKDAVQGVNTAIAAAAAVAEAEAPALAPAIAAGTAAAEASADKAVAVAVEQLETRAV